MLENRASSGGVSATAVMKIDGISKERRDRFTEHTTRVVLAYRGKK